MRAKVGVGIIGVLLLVAVLGTGAAAVQAKENKRWHRLSVTAISRDRAIAGSDTRIAGFRTPDGERRWPRVAVDDRIYRGNRYDAWRAGRDELRLDNPRYDAAVTLVVSSIIGLCFGVLIALIGGMLYDILRSRR